MGHESDGGDRYVTNGTTLGAENEAINTARHLQLRQTFPNTFAPRAPSRGKTSQFSMKQRNLSSSQSEMAWRLKPKTLNDRNSSYSGKESPDDCPIFAGASVSSSSTAVSRKSRENSPSLRRFASDGANGKIRPYSGSKPNVKVVSSQPFQVPPTQPLLLKIILTWYFSVHGWRYKENNFVSHEEATAHVIDELQKRADRYHKMVQAAQSRTEVWKSSLRKALASRDLLSSHLYHVHRRADLSLLYCIFRSWMTISSKEIIELKENNEIVHNPNQYLEDEQIQLQKEVELLEKLVEMRTSTVEANAEAMRQRLNRLQVRRVFSRWYDLIIPRGYIEQVPLECENIEDGPSFGENEVEIPFLSLLFGEDEYVFEDSEEIDPATIKGPSSFDVPQFGYPDVHLAPDPLNPIVQEYSIENSFNNNSYEEWSFGDYSPNIPHIKHSCSTIIEVPSPAHSSPLNDTCIPSYSYYPHVPEDCDEKDQKRFLLSDNDEEEISQSVLEEDQNEKKNCSPYNASPSSDVPPLNLSSVHDAMGRAGEAHMVPQKVPKWNYFEEESDMDSDAMMDCMMLCYDDSTMEGKSSGSSDRTNSKESSERTYSKESTVDDDRGVKESVDGHLSKESSEDNCSKESTLDIKRGSKDLETGSKESSQGNLSKESSINDPIPQEIGKEIHLSQQSFVENRRTIHNAHGGKSVNDVGAYHDRCALLENDHRQHLIPLSSLSQDDIELKTRLYEQERSDQSMDGWDVVGSKCHLYSDQDQEPLTSTVGIQSNVDAASFGIQTGVCTEYHPILDNKENQTIIRKHSTEASQTIWRTHSQSTQTIISGIPSHTSLHTIPILIYRSYARRLLRTSFRVWQYMRRKQLYNMILSQYTITILQFSFKAWAGYINAIRRQHQVQISTNQSYQKYVTNMPGKSSYYPRNNILDYGLSTRIRGPSCEERGQIIILRRHEQFFNLWRRNVIESRATTMAKLSIFRKKWRREILSTCFKALQPVATSFEQLDNKFLLLQQRRERRRQDIEF